MKTVLKFTAFSVIALILAGGLTSCQKELKPSQLGPYVLISPKEAIMPGGTTKKIDFIDETRLAVLHPTFNAETKYHREEFTYMIRGRNIELTHISETITGGTTSVHRFRWINDSKFEIWGMLITSGGTATPAIFEKISEQIPSL